MITENLTTEQAESLQQQLNSLPTQDSEFIRDYLVTMIRGNRFVRNWRNSPIYLPYSGSDLEMVIRLFRGFVRLQYSEFVIDKLNTPIIEHLALIATGNSEKNGLVLRGECGVGKTATLKVWSKFRATVLASSAMKLKLKQPLRFDDTNEYLPKITFMDPISLLSGFTKLGYEFFTEKMGDILILDDLGTTTSINYFGSQVNILEQLILSRYAEFKQNPNIEFYGTTNLTTDQLTELIGQRAMSRLSEMTAWKEGLILGNDRRKDNQKLTVWPKI